jgi:glycosyltransferase involved in cell wall biosynthesis
MGFCEMADVSAAGVAEALELLYTNKELRREMARKAQQRATAPEYQWDNIAEQWRELFHALLDGQSPASSCGCPA